MMGMLISAALTSDVIVGHAEADRLSAYETSADPMADAGSTGGSSPAAVRRQLSRAERFYQQGAWLQSLRLARQIVSIQPDDQNALRLMLDSMARLQVIGRKAEAAITLARRLRPDDPVILASIAKLRTAQGREAEAGSARASFAATCPFNCSQIMNR